MWVPQLVVPSFEKPPPKTEKIFAFYCNIRDNQMPVLVRVHVQWLETYQVSAPYPQDIQYVLTAYSTI